MKYKKLFITFTVIFSILLALSIFIMIWFWGDRYDDFNDFSSEVEIPGLKDGACPQGITVYQGKTVTEKDESGNTVEVVKEQNYFFITAYFKDKPSRIYVMGDQTGEIGYVTLQNDDGTDHTGHVGGIATNGRYIWVCSGNTIYVAKDGNNSNDSIAVKLIKEAKKNGSLKFTSSFNANCNAAFLYYYDAEEASPSSPSSYDYLYVGEFYRDGNYETDGLHHLTTPNGETNKAFAYEYRVYSSSSNDAAVKYGVYTWDNGIDGEGVNVPRIYNIFSLPNEVQGFARTKNGLVLSVSYGLKNSHIYYYNFEWASLGSSSHPNNGNRVKYTEIAKDDADRNKLYREGFKYDGATFTTSAAQYRDESVNVYYIDSSTMRNDYSIPSMSEGLCTLGDRVYVLFESGAKKYSTFVRQVLTNVYSFIPRSKH